MPYLSPEAIASKTYEVGSSKISEDELSKMAPPPHMEEIMEMSRPTDQVLMAKITRFCNMPVTDFSSSLFHSVAHKIELINCEWSLRIEVPSSAHTVARIIHLLGTGINWDGFRDIMTSFPSMHTLVYTRPADEIDTHFDLVGKVLAHYGTNLEHLTMLNEHYMPFCSPLGSLSTLINLKSLEIHLELLIGFRENPNGYEEYMDFGFFEPDDVVDYEEVNRYAGDWSLVSLLPTSLETLTLHIEDPKLEVYFNTYERYGAKIEELLTAEHLFKSLTEISAPGLTAVEKKIRARHTGWVLTAQIAMQRPSTKLDFEDDNRDCEVLPMDNYMEDIKDDASTETFKDEEQSDW
ncbi:hypothetical protein F5B17DRAFT_431383 [Nemania serpens]|nr:hypothetical protein F5B17DRAFT_431383 [Nemania serpens]